MKFIPALFICGFAALSFVCRFSFLWIFPSLIGLFFLWVGWEVLKSRRDFRKRGYGVYGAANNGFRYREKHGDAVRELILPGELIEPGHAVYYQQSDEEWTRQVPDWARGRRYEIESRILEDPHHRPW